MNTEETYYQVKIDFDKDSYSDWCYENVSLWAMKGDPDRINSYCFANLEDALAFKIKFGL